ncbi:hypothetical protein GK2107 [Geobacillus kaustophilus HTA426]|uniref:Transposase IS200-like domain-containing protein n=2 Tax=Geobacillus thermoleovorans group TaxID=1505648 RepID=Q5KY44_GEOKA|nr:hypothetical protein GK2107 [Geobacillus kaustophilus HTA426]
MLGNPLRGLLRATIFLFRCCSIIIKTDTIYNMEQEYRRTKTTVSLIYYHFVFCPRYRRKVLVGRVEERFKQLVEKFAKRMMGSSLRWK